MSTVTEYSYPSKTGLAEIYAKSWLPDDKTAVKAVFQIAHGMAEYIERYNGFAHYLTEKGFAVYSNEHIGHGRSCKADEELGYFGESGGWDAFVEDARALTGIAKKEFPGLPIIIFGHSMGSFVMREYARRYGGDADIKGFIFCGTSGKNPGAPAGILLTNIISKFKGSHYRSKLIDSIAFGSYNKKYDSPRTAFDWLTREEDIVDAYIADKYCGFLFTAAGYRDMFTVLSKVSGEDWYNGLNKDKPVLVISGSDDPVGSYGKGIEQVFADIKAAGVKDAQMKLYENCRHEILNEINREDVYNDIINWSLSKI